MRSRMKLLSVLFVFALCNASLAMPRNFDGSTRQILAIDGPLYVDSASLKPAFLTSIQGTKRSNLNLNNRNGFNSLQAQNMMKKLIRMHNDPQTNFQLDNIDFAQNNPLEFDQNDQLQRFISIKQLQNPYTRMDAGQNLQFDHMNAQNDQIMTLLFQFDKNAFAQNNPLKFDQNDHLKRFIAIKQLQNPYTRMDAGQNLQFDHMNAQNDQILRLLIQLDNNAFAQNNPLEFDQNDHLKRFITIKQLQNPYTRMDAGQNLQFDHMNQNSQIKTVVPQEGILRVFTIPIVNPYALNDVSQTIELDQLNAQIDFLHQLKLNQLNGIQQNGPMQWVQNQPSQFHQQDDPQTILLDQLNAQIDFLHQLKLNQLNGNQLNGPMQWVQNQPSQFHQQNPYTQNEPFNPNQFGQFNPQNDFIVYHQFDQNRAQNDQMHQLALHHQLHPHFNNFVAAQNVQNFQNNPVEWWNMGAVAVGMTPDENNNDEQFQGFGTNLQNDQFQNWHGNAQQDQFQNFARRYQQQGNQRQDFGMILNDFAQNDESESSDDFVSEISNDEDYN